MNFRVRSQAILTVAFLAVYSSQALAAENPPPQRTHWRMVAASLGGAAAGCVGEDKLLSEFAAKSSHKILILVGGCTMGAILGAGAGGTLGKWFDERAYEHKLKQTQGEAPVATPTEGSATSMR